MLDDIELPLVQEIATHDRRVLVEHKPPGMAGSLLQNLGRRPVRLTLWGVATGSEALEAIEQLQAKFQAGEPLSFVSDIVVDAEIETMIIDDLQLQELAGKPQRYAYVLTLREYIEPVEPEDTSLLDAEILDDAQNLVGDLVNGIDLAADFATGLEQFLPQLSNLLTRLQDFRDAVNRAREG
jgi:hypothetical protein